MPSPKPCCNEREVRILYTLFAWLIHIIMECRSGSFPSAESWLRLLGWGSYVQQRSSLTDSTQSRTGKAGSGLVISRLPTGEWSAPSCIGTAGVGWGLQIGADITDFVIVLNTDEAVKAFSMGQNVTIGGNVSATAGPIGTGAGVQTSLANPAPMFSYSKSKGSDLPPYTAPT